MFVFIKKPQKYKFDMLNQMHRLNKDHLTKDNYQLLNN